MKRHVALKAVHSDLDISRFLDVARVVARIPEHLGDAVEDSAVVNKLLNAKCSNTARAPNFVRMEQEIIDK